MPVFQLHFKNLKKNTMKKKTLIIVIVTAVILISVLIMLKPKTVNPDRIHIETAKVDIGKINKLVTATGTIEAIKTVEVGTQVSGIIENIFVDFNSYVKKGQLLAKIDTTNLAAALEQSRASLENAKAELDYQQANYNRLTPLNDKKLISQSDFDQTVYNLNKAKANYHSVLAQHKKNQISLEYALIYSPIDGIILNRAVEEGQTVAASFSTPTLFTIANDLTQMKVEAKVDEADIGQVKKGQRVEFKVDAFPDDVFTGEVSEVRMEPTVTNNVVTYTIIISAQNPDFKLMPGMTAETSIFVLEKYDIMVVPSKALRFSPDQKLLMSYYEGIRDSTKIPEELNTNSNTDTEIKEPVVWVKNKFILRQQQVKTGLNDDNSVEILSGLNPGDEVVLSLEDKGNVKPKAGGNSLMPSPPKRR